MEHLTYNNKRRKVWASVDCIGKVDSEGKQCSKCKTVSSGVRARSSKFSRMFEDPQSSNLLPSAYDLPYYIAQCYMKFNDETSFLGMIKL